jgi:hypothetical protein
MKVTGKEEGFMLSSSSIKRLLEEFEKSKSSCGEFEKRRSKL